MERVAGSNAWESLQQEVNGGHSPLDCHEARYQISQCLTGMATASFQSQAMFMTTGLLKYACVDIWLIYIYICGLYTANVWSCRSFDMKWLR